MWLKSGPYCPFSSKLRALRAAVNSFRGPLVVGGGLEACPGNGVLRRVGGIGTNSARLRGGELETLKVVGTRQRDAFGAQSEEPAEVEVLRAFRIPALRLAIKRLAPFSVWSTTVRIHQRKSVTVSLDPQGPFREAWEPEDVRTASFWTQRRVLGTRVLSCSQGTRSATTEGGLGTKAVLHCGAVADKGLPAT